MNTTYDPQVLVGFAQRLLSRATTIVIAWTLLGLLLGAVAYFYFSVVTRVLNGGPAGMLAVLAGGLGYLSGSQRALMLRVQAQTLLCQISIEQGIRRIASTIPGQPEAGTYG